MRCYVAVLLLLSVFTLRTQIYAQDCTLPTNDEIFKEGIEEMLESQQGEGNQMITIELHNYTYTCLATGTTKGTYRWMAFVSNFTRSDAIEYRLFTVRCLSGSWEFLNDFSDDRVIGDEAVAANLLDTENPRTDCSICRVDTDDTNSLETCIACPDCVGLNLCYQDGGATCCNYYDEDTCVQSCPVNHVVDQTFNCVCVQFFEEPSCTNCIIEDSDCNNNGVANTTSCTCDCYNTGYDGITCDTDINECEDGTNPCINGECNNIPGGYNCTCDAGYTGDNCGVDIDDCDPNPCANGQCTDLVDSYTCDCDAGFTGGDCDVDVDDCQSDPCVNGQCTDSGRNSYTCSCDTGFTGDDCDVDVNECLDNPCANGGRCSNDEGSFSCDCQSTGYKGDTCSEDVNECEEHDDACLNNGECRNEDGQFSCSCRGGWDGDICDVCASGYTLYEEACVECDVSSCTQCSRPNVCFTCESGFVADSDTGNCLSNDGRESQTGGAGSLSIGVIIGIVVALLLIVIFVAVIIVIGIVAGVTYKKSQDPTVVHTMKNPKDEQKDIILTKMSEI